MLKVFSLSGNQQTDARVEKSLKYPDRVRYTVLRPNGRTLEIFVSGAIDGEIILALSNSAFRCFNAQREKDLKDCRHRLIAVSPPGYGGTSPPSKDQSFFDCASADLVAVLDQLGASSAKVFATFTSLVLGLELASRYPDRVKEIMTVIFLPPAPYELVPSDKNRFLRTFANLWKTYPSLQKVTIALLARSFSALNAVQIFQAIFPNNYKDILSIGIKASHDELQDSISSSCAQGYSYVADEFQRALADWGDLLRDCPVPVRSFREKNALFASELSYDSFCKDFAADFHTDWQEGSGPIGPELIDWMIKDTV